MTPEQFRTLRKANGWTQSALAKEWGMGPHGGRTIRRWELGEAPINPIAAYALRSMNEREDE